MGLFKKKETEEVKSKFMFYEKEKEKIGKKSILFIIIMALIGLCMIFSISTYLRWNRDVENRKEVLLIEENEKLGYYNDKNEFVEVKTLSDFYGTEEDVEIRENEGIVVYCGKKKVSRSDCISINPSDNLENVMRKPYTIINLLVIIELLLLFELLISLPTVKPIVVKICGIVIILYGVFLVGYQIFNVTSYYYFVNNNKNVVDGTIVREIRDSEVNNKRLPIIKYTVEDKDYTYYSLVKTDKKIGDTITLYYGKKDYSKVTEKKNPFKILDILISFVVIAIGIMFIKVLPNKINIKKEEPKESKESEEKA